MKGKTSPAQAKPEDLLLDDDEDGEGGTMTAEQVRTKNELMDVKIVIPEVEEVAEHESLEKVGEIMSIIDKVVIVKGVHSQIPNRSSERALDSDTLLVFDDRKVLGYVRVMLSPSTRLLFVVTRRFTRPLVPRTSHFTAFSLTIPTH